MVTIAPASEASRKGSAASTRRTVPSMSERNEASQFSSVEGIARADTFATTTSIPPKTALGGQTVSIGMPGHFTATMPAGTSKLASDNRLTTWGATLPGGSTITFTARTAVSIADRFKTSVGRIDVTRYGAHVNLDLGVTGTPPRFGAFATGSGAEWDTSTTTSSGRVTLIDGGSMAYLLVLQRAGGPPTGDIAAYLAVSASLTSA